MRFGIDIGGTNLKFGVFSENGELIEFYSRKFSDIIKKGELLSFLENEVGSLTERYNINVGGFAIKGLVDAEKCRAVNDIASGQLLANKNICEQFENKYNLAIQIDNDARAYAYGEYQFGAGRNYDSMLCLTLGTGIGFAYIQQGEAYTGSDQLGGTLGGHISINKDGPKCECGNYGCFENYCSAAAIAKRIRNRHAELDGDIDVLPEFFDKTGQNNDYAQTLDKIIHDLAVGIVNLINAYNPEIVVLGGGLMKSSHLILPKLKPKVAKMAWKVPRGKVDLAPAELEDKAAPKGIAFHPKLERKI